MSAERDSESRGRSERISRKTRGRRDVVSAQASAEGRCVPSSAAAVVSPYAPGLARSFLDRSSTYGERFGSGLNYIVAQAPGVGGLGAGIETVDFVSEGGLRWGGFGAELALRSCSGESGLYVVRLLLENGAWHALGVDTGRDCLYDCAPDDGSFVSNVAVLASLEAGGAEIRDVRRLVVGPRKETKRKRKRKRA